MLSTHGSVAHSASGKSGIKLCIQSTVLVRLLVRIFCGFGDRINMMIALCSWALAAWLLCFLICGLEPCWAVFSFGKTWLCVCVCGSRLILEE